MEEGTATDSNILVWRVPWTEEPVWAIVRRVTESDLAKATEHVHRHQMKTRGSKTSNF